ncbi:2-keto-4-pentenoate hydratase [Microvirga sp. 2TAF3]|uniref:2-keto-4-pentenoate hydratase n=1 Tax=Microvirga sp. 2TAF3 TaxID=3233014 RepID=UPI003F95D399
MSPDQVEELGTALARCRQHGTVSPLRLDRIASAEDAEAVQAAAVEAYGGIPRGYSIHATTALSRRLLCCDEPFFGPLLDSDLVLNGSSFHLPYGVLGAGCTLTFVVGEPYPMDEGEISRETVSRALAGCWLAIEVLGRRVPGSVPLNAYTATADFGLEILHVQGPFIKHWDSLDLATARGSVRLNGDPVASGCFGDVLGHPLEAIAYLARVMKARGQELEPGDIISTGTCTGILQVVPGQVFEAEFGGLGSVKISFE